MSGPVVRAVTTATKAQLAADQDNTPAAFDAYWFAFLPGWSVYKNSRHMQDRVRDEAIRGTIMERAQS